VPNPDDQDFEDLTFGAKISEAKAALRIAETSSLSWLALEQREQVLVNGCSQASRFAAIILDSTTPIFLLEFAPLWNVSPQ
jgi:hypothetical protein